MRIIRRRRLQRFNTLLLLLTLLIWNERAAPQTWGEHPKSQSMFDDGMFISGTGELYHSTTSSTNSPTTGSSSESTTESSTESSSAASSSTSTYTTPKTSSPYLWTTIASNTNTGAQAKGSTNLLFIVCDQLRFDALSYAQNRLPDYDNPEILKIRTPNIDRLAARGAYFTDAYCK